MADSDVLTVQDTLCQELDEIESRRHLRARNPSDVIVRDDLETYEQRAHRLQLSALCLSGGGIRSAAFCLGVLQALATKRLLRQFDYLSTVSGGGFIGGWLQVLIRDCGGVGTAEEEIAGQRPAALDRLRAYTNYLTPQTGPFSTDTWAGIVLYLRNLLINWAVFAPLFLLLTLVPIFYQTAIWACSDAFWLNLALLTAGGVSLLTGVVRACSLLPSHRPPRTTHDSTPTYASARSISWGVVYPALGWTLFVPWLLDFADGPSPPKAQPSPDKLWFTHHAYWVIPAIYFSFVVVAYLLAWWWQSYRTDPGIRLFKANFGRWLVASMGSALLTLFMLVLAASNLPLEKLESGHGPHVDTATVLTVFAPLGLAVVHVLQTSLFVALRRETELADLDREWLGRVNAMILRLAVGWTIFAVCCLMFPMFVHLVQEGKDGNFWSGGTITLAGAITMLLGGAAAFLGKIWPSVEELVENPTIRDRVRAWLPVALGALFAVCLLVVFGGVLYFALARLQLAVGAALQLTVLPTWLPLILQLIVGAILFAGVMTFRHVNVNRFSMHSVYRNRLTRAFLGSARSRRDQDPFTGFDPQDNTPLASLSRSANSLFPVINMTLNMTAGTNTAWAERQAASFTATPLACGSAALRHPHQAPAEASPRGAFVPTTRFAGLETLGEHPISGPECGPGLGSVLTVSGAAVSPSWGYHSSRITAFLMTLFNVRLGIWLPNPSKASADDLRLARPKNSLMALIDEMLGETTDDSQAIYLSDGGHFENLGIYEMFRRRCSAILVVDAGADEACTLFDLGNAIRKAEIDLGITIKMREPMRVYSRDRLETESNLGATALGFAFADVEYGDGHTGQLLYIKPSFLPEIPVDVRSYGAEHKTFPNESTLDQWFSESQFESYRMLGKHQMAELVKPLQKGDLAGLFAAADQKAQPMAPAPETTTCDGIRTLASVIAGRIGPARNGPEQLAAE